MICLALFLALYNFISTAGRKANDSTSSSPVSIPAPQTPMHSSTMITSVTPILARSDQPIIIRGHGFGDSAPIVRRLGDSVDTVADDTRPSLAIIDQGPGAHSWSAGRTTSRNFDAIGVKLASWSDSEIRLNGFGSALGGFWKVAKGDPIVVRIFRHGDSESATFDTVVQ